MQINGIVAAFFFLDFFPFYFCSSPFVKTLLQYPYCLFHITATATATAYERSPRIRRAS